ncbi:hypothetical protein GOP47_0011527 [Adiantum capillus-veneris]|uniref:Uncharacterized protein n=1 Tax=Adiantum capillus-veneris TaxID=13818 RepID=A0A9D4UTD3_ADICA|nr:hypothetical protein GOP47_0011527 [Adiantum capillus-veneris]
MASPAGLEIKDVAPGRTRVGWIGTGVMGQSMCGHILAAGYSVCVYNRTAGKAEGLCKKGAVFLESPKAVAEQSNVVFTIVGYPSDVDEVILGDNGIIKGLNSGGVVVDMTTSDPALAQKIFAAAKERSCHAVDAPVSGGDVGAKAGKLAIFAGGEEHIVRALTPLFSCMGSVTYMGSAGLGQSTKMGNQIIIATTMLGLVEGMLFACKAGLDVTVFLQAVAGGLAGSKSLQLYASRLLKRDLEPGFYVNHFVKDLGIATEECRRMGLSLPGLALAQQLYVSLQAHGEGNLGTQALVLALERLNNMELPTVKS